jgi:CheY-like chemotaxis protein
MPERDPLIEELPAMIHGDGERVLVVEDELATREVLADGLRSLNYRVQEAVDGREALSILEQDWTEIELVLSDLVMPDMGGKALLHALDKKGWPGQMILLSGHPLGNLQDEGIDSEGVAAVLTKPVHLGQLAQAVRQALRENSSREFDTIDAKPAGD